MTKTDNKLVEKVKRADAILADPRLTHAEKCVGLTLLLHFHNTKTGKCHPSLRQQAEASGANKDTVINALKKLKALGHLDFEENAGGRQVRNSYTFKTVGSDDPLATETVGFTGGKRSDSPAETVGSSDSQLPSELPSEKKPSEKRERRRRLTPISADAKMTPKQVEIAASMGFTTKEARSPVWQKFRDYHISKGNTFADWDAAWRNWLRKESEFTNNGSGGANGGRGWDNPRIGDIMVNDAGKRFEYGGVGVAGGWLELDF
jgi:Helix-turn-helix domain